MSTDALGEQFGSLRETYSDWGEDGNRTHITRELRGTLPTSMLAQMPGASGEVPGEHRKRSGETWRAFVDDVRTNGIKNPVFVTVDYGQPPRLSEGNHRRDAAVELGLAEVPVQVRFFGNASWDDAERYA